MAAPPQGLARQTEASFHDGIELVAEPRRRNPVLPALLISVRVTKSLGDPARGSGLAT